MTDLPRGVLRRLGAKHHPAQVPVHRPHEETFSRSAAITAMSMDMGPAYEKSARKEHHAVNAVICYDPFHVVQLVTTALDKVRRSVWQDLRKLPDQQAAKRFRAPAGRC